MVRCRGLPLARPFSAFIGYDFKKEVNLLLEDLKGPIDNLEERIYGMRDSL